LPNGNLEGNGRSGMVFDANNGNNVMDFASIDGVSFRVP